MNCQSTYTSFTVQLLSEVAPTSGVRKRTLSAPAGLSEGHMQPVEGFTMMFR
jgi:hypothetical protein